MPAKSDHPSDSSEQQAAESAMIAALEQQLQLSLSDSAPPSAALALDGFNNDHGTPICVEAWAHQGKAKGSQPAKVMKDICKLLLVEKLLGRKCRKVIVTCDEKAIAFLQGAGWMAKFVAELGIELMVVSIPESLCRVVEEAQRRQYR